MLQMHPQTAIRLLLVSAPWNTGPDLAKHLASFADEHIFGATEERNFSVLANMLVMSDFGRLVKVLGLSEDQQTGLAHAIAKEWSLYRDPSLEIGPGLVFTVKHRKTGKPKTVRVWIDGQGHAVMYVVNTGQSHRGGIRDTVQSLASSKIENLDMGQAACHRLTRALERMQEEYLRNGL